MPKSKMRKYSKQKIKKDKLSKSVNKVNKTDKNITDNTTNFEEFYASRDSSSNIVLSGDIIETCDVTLDRKILGQLGYELQIVNDTILKIIKDGELIQNIEIVPTYIFEGKKYRITKVANELFKNCCELLSVKLPNTIIEIGDKAFLGCKHLSEIKIPTTISKIGDYAFLGCRELAEINFPLNAQIGKGAFEYCEFLPYSFRSRLNKNIEDKQENQDELDLEMEFKAKIDHPPVIKFFITIGYILAFCSIIISFYSNLAPVKLQIADFVLNIGCSLLLIPLAGLIFIVLMFDLWPNRNEINNTTLNRLGYGYKFDIKEIKIPKFYSIIKKYTDRKSKDINAKLVTTYTKNIYKITAIGKNAFNQCTNLEKVVIPDSVTQIKDSAFYACTNLTEIDIPNFVTEIGDSAFCNCKSLTKIVIPNSVIKIGKFAFYGCKSLEYVSLPKRFENNLGNIGFDRVENIIYRDLDEFDNKIETNNEVNLTKEESVQIFDDEKDKDDEKDIIGESIQEIDGDVEKVEEEIEDNLDNVEDEQFILNQQGMALFLPLIIGGFSIFILSLLLPVFGVKLFVTNIISFLIILFFIWFTIKIYPTPEEINDKLLNELDLYQYKYIFNYFEIPITYVSKSIRFNGRRFLITKIGNRAFKDCTNLKFIKIPDSIKKIGLEAFSGCTGLTTLKVPDSVKEIKENAFLGVKNVIYNGSAIGAPWGADNINGKEILSLAKEATNRQQYYIQKYLLKTDFIDSKKEKFSNVLVVIFALFICFFTVFILSMSPSIDKNKMYKEIGIPILGLIIVSIPSMIYYSVYKNELNNYTLKFITKKNKFKITSLDIPEIYDSSLPSVQRFYDYNNKKFFITSIKKGLFKNCINLKEVKIPDSVCRIGAEAFSGCTGIDNIKIPDYVVEVGKNAFLGVNNVIYNGNDPNAPWGAKALNGKYV